LSFESVYQIKNIREEFSRYVWSQTNMEINNGTRNDAISLSTVNEKNRFHYYVKKPDDDRKNLFIT